MPPLCSWDTKPNPSYNYYGTGNVEEILPGVLRPLSADLVVLETNHWARRIVEIMENGDLVDYRPLPHDNIFAIVGGRVAVNIQWLGAFVATYQPDQQADMLSQFLRGDREGMKSGVSADVGRARRTRRRMVRLWERSSSRAADEVKRAEGWRKRSLNTRRIAKMSDGDLLASIDRTAALCGEMWVRHSQTSMAGGEYLGILSNFLDEAVPGHPPEWSTTLTSSLGGVVSTEPVLRTWDLAKLARSKRSVAAAFRGESVDAIRAKLAEPPDAAWQEFAAAFAAFLDEYGFRGQGELDPATPDWGEDPTFVIASVRSHLALAASKDPAKREGKGSAAREKLEQRIEAGLPEEKNEEFQVLLRQTQTFVKDRELTKANVVRVTRAYRPAVRELARRLEERGVLAAPEDVWYLRLDELRQAVAGDLPGRTANGRISKRREEHRRLEGFDIPVVFTLPVELVPIEEPAKRQKELSGMGVSPGTATGRARVILSAEAGDEAQMEEGDVLIAPISDTAWTPLFWPAAAVVIERGGMLSHAATVARELGLPAVVGVPNATKLIPDGARVTVNGATGTVTIER